MNKVIFPCFNFFLSLRFHSKSFHFIDKIRFVYFKRSGVSFFKHDGQKNSPPASDNWPFWNNFEHKKHFLSSLFFFKSFISNPNVLRSLFSSNSRPTLKAFNMLFNRFTISFILNIHLLIATVIRKNIRKISIGRPRTSIVFLLSRC
jgi:hypothetical protein